MLEITVCSKKSYANDSTKIAENQLCSLFRN